MRLIQPSSMYTHSHHKCANSLPKQQGKRPNRKFTKKKKLSQLVKSKMLGIKFVNHASEQAERRKLQEQSMHAPHFILASMFHSYLFSCCAFYTSYTTLNKDKATMKKWIKSKQNKQRKKRPKFFMQTYGARMTNLHAPTIDGMRSPYDLQVSRNKAAVTLLLPVYTWHFDVAGHPVDPRGEAGGLARRELLGQEEVVVFFPHRHVPCSPQPRPTVQVERPSHHQSSYFVTYMS